MAVRSGIGRPIDPSYPSNRFVLVVAPVAGVIAAVVALLSDQGAGNSLRAGILGSGAAFLAWAIAREIDPDSTISAGIAAVAAPAAMLAGDPALGQSAVVLFAARLLVRSTGLFPTIADLAVVAGFIVYAGTTDGGLPVALVGSAALAADFRLPGQAPGRQVWFALAGAAGAVIAAILTDGISIDPLRPSGGQWVLVGVAAVGALLLARPGIVVSTADHGDLVLSPVRLRAARAAALAAGLGGFAWLGGPALAALAPVWVPMAAAFIVGLAPRRT